MVRGLASSVLAVTTGLSLPPGGCGESDALAPQNADESALRELSARTDEGKRSLAHGSRARPRGNTKAVGLSLWWKNGKVRMDDGSPKTVRLYEDFPRYVRELDISSSMETDTDQGIRPIMTQGDLAGLDWAGVEHVETLWRPVAGGEGFTRQRFYRGARWMEQHSIFALVPVDGQGRPVGAPILAKAGFDDAWLRSDDGFVRRFVARQLTFGCAAIDDCSTATGYAAQAFVQLRTELHPERRSRRIPAEAKALQLVWTADRGHERKVLVEHADYDESQWEYGFEFHLEVATEPANGQFFMPGESLDVQVTFTDGAGNRLHPEGRLPTYQAFMEDAIDSGLRYYDGLENLLTPYYVLKHREGLTMWSLAGPTDALKTPSQTVSFADFFLPQATTATVEDDGYSAVVQLNPSIPQQLNPGLSALRHRRARR